jgi:hypothetical protein
MEQQTQVKCPDAGCDGQMDIPPNMMKVQVNVGDFASVLVIPNAVFKCKKCFQEFQARLANFNPQVLFSPQSMQFTFVKAAPANGILTPPPKGNIIVAP